MFLNTCPRKNLSDDNIHLCVKREFFTIESIDICNSITNIYLRNSLNYFTISRLKYKNHTLFFQHLLLLSGDISLNPGPLQEQSQLNNEMWSPFRKRGLHFLHLNINSILPKIDELRHIAKVSNVSVIGISESKLDSSVQNSEISIPGYDILRCDRNRHGGGVASYIRNDICFNQIKVFSKVVEQVFFDILLPNSHSITVGIFYRPSDQSKFLEAIFNDFNKLYTEKRELIILGDFNINLFYNGKYLLDGNKTSLRDSTATHPLLKLYKQFLSDFGLKQLIKSPTRITSESSTLIDHIITNVHEKISQSGVIDIGISYHNIIFCTRKIVKIKPGIQKYINFRSFKNYSAETFEEALKDLDFPNYANFNDVNSAYSDFITKVTKVIDKVAPSKQSRIKNNTQEWFDSEITEKIEIRDRLFKKFKKSKLHVDEKLFKESKKKLQIL